MHLEDLSDWQHDHTFGQDVVKAGENRTLAVVIVTFLMMIVEVSAGIFFGSMALLADGLHMASHAVALGIAVVAYVISRRLATDRRFSFGVGKINSLAGFASAVLLLGFALVMVVESTSRLISPVTIDFDNALAVAFIGLIVNGLCAWILSTTPHDHDDHHHHDHGHDHHHHDHNLRGAYLHVLADAMTSFLAIFALLSGKYFGLSWLDPMMGIVGAVLITHWSLGLIRSTSKILLDRQADSQTLDRIRGAIEEGTEDRVSDIHVWHIGQGILAAEISVIGHDPVSPNDYKGRIPQTLGIRHLTIEVHDCPDH